MYTVAVQSYDILVEVGQVIDNVTVTGGGSGTVSGDVLLYLTGDQVTTTVDTFFTAVQEERGTVATAGINVTVNDNEIMPFDADFLTVTVPEERDLAGGTYQGQIEVERSGSAGGTERIFMEVYLCDIDGNVIDSGLSLPVGDLGVIPVLTLQTSEVDLPTNISTLPIIGTLDQPYTTPPNTRFRLHFLAQKIGTAGGAKNLEIFFGTDHNSFFVVKGLIFLDDLSNVEITNPSVNDSLVYDGSIWVNGVPGVLSVTGSVLAVNVINKTGEALQNELPKVLQAISNGSEDNGDAIKADALTMSEEAVFGLNNSDALQDGSTQIISYGPLKNVNTSAWNIGTRLFLDVLNPGELTDSAPVSDSFYIGSVYKADPVDGVIFINTIKFADPVTVSIPQSFSSAFFQFDDVVTAAGTFKQIQLGKSGLSSGNVEAFQIGTDIPTPVDFDFLGDLYAVEKTFNAGLYESILKIDSSTTGSTSSDERIVIEVYKADADGNVINEPASEFPVGSLGVNPILVLIYDGDLSTTSGFEDVLLKGTIATPLLFAANQRARFRILCEKVGGDVGSLKTYRIRVGNSNESFLNVPKEILLGDLEDVKITNPQDGDKLTFQNGVWINQA